MKGFVDSIGLFLTVVETQSFTLAAKRRAVSQANVSVVIQNLETDLGYKLFERDGRHISITPQGEVLYQHSKVLMDKVNLFSEFAVNLENKPQKDLSIGVVDTLCSPIMTQVLQKFQSTFPSVRVKLKFGNAKDLLHKFDNSDLDMLFALPANMLPSSQSRILIQNVRRTWVGHKKYADMIEKMDMKEQFFMFRFLFSSDSFDHSFNDMVNMDNFWQVDDNSMIIKLCQTGECIGNIPFFVLPYAKKQKDIVELKSVFLPELTQDIYLLWREREQSCYQDWLVSHFS